MKFSVTQHCSPTEPHRPRVTRGAAAGCGAAAPRGLLTGSTAEETLPTPQPFCCYTVTTMEVSSTSLKLLVLCSYSCGSLQQETRELWWQICLVQKNLGQSSGNHEHVAARCCCGRNCTPRRSRAALRRVPRGHTAAAAPRSGGQPGALRRVRQKTSSPCPCTQGPLPRGSTPLGSLRLY